MKKFFDKTSTKNLLIALALVMALGFVALGMFGYALLQTGGPVLMHDMHFCSEEPIEQRIAKWKTVVEGIDGKIPDEDIASLLISFALELEKSDTPNKANNNYLLANWCFECALKYAEKSDTELSRGMAHTCKLNLKYLKSLHEGVPVAKAFLKELGSTSSIDSLDKWLDLDLVNKSEQESLAGTFRLFRSKVGTINEIKKVKFKELTFDQIKRWNEVEYRGLYVFEFSSEKVNSGESNILLGRNRNKWSVIDFQFD